MTAIWSVLSGILSAIAKITPLILAYLAGQRGATARQAERAAEDTQDMLDATTDAPRGRSEVVERLRKGGL